jgi:transcriptional regulator
MNFNLSTRRHVEALLVYNPKQFQSTDIHEAFELMNQYPFATVVTVRDSEATISHLPLTPIWAGEKIELIGHLAKANPHWKILKNHPTTVVFHGPHTFITPKWYTQDDVPTWNYSAIHAKGNVELFEEHDGIVECLKQLTAHVERQWPSGWEFTIPDDLAAEVLANSIVGFKFRIEEFQFKRKLSQNRSDEDQMGIMKGLQSRTDENSHLVLKDMQRLFLQAQKK